MSHVDIVCWTRHTGLVPLPVASLSSYSYLIFYLFLLLSPPLLIPIALPHRGFSSHLSLSHAHTHVDTHIISPSNGFPLRLRESLRPYVQDQLDLASSEGTPALRPMTFDFTDAECVNANDQFMFGPKFLVAPVLYYQAQNRSVYLPSLPDGERWAYHYNTSIVFADGMTHVVPTTNVSEFPLFVRTKIVDTQSSPEYALD